MCKHNIIKYISIAFTAFVERLKVVKNKSLFLNKLIFVSPVVNSARLTLKRISSRSSRNKAKHTDDLLIREKVVKIRK